MCAASFIMDHFGDKWQRQADEWRRMREPLYPPTAPLPRPFITSEEIAEFRKLLDRARVYDKQHAQPECEMESKRKRVKELAESLGVEIDFV